MSESRIPRRRPTFAVVVPIHNEAADIAPTCEALLALAPPADEIIFVDDASTDESVPILRRYLVRPSIRLIVQPANRGPAAARNAGIMAATSEVMVFVDADVLLPPDFLARLSPHYEEGADCVAVEATELSDTDNVYRRFLHAQHWRFYGSDPTRAPGWTQAFSCRRSLALSAGLFPEVLPGPGGEDGEFARRLSQQTAKRVVDRTIVVSHEAPSTMRDFWRQWRGRGVSVPFFRHRIDGVPWPLLIAERLAAAGWSLLFVVTIVPAAWRGVRLALLSTRRWSDVPAFTGLLILQLLAHRLGEWRGLVRLALASRSDAG